MTFALNNNFLLSNQDIQSVSYPFISYVMSNFVKLSIEIRKTKSSLK